MSGQGRPLRFLAGVAVGWIGLRVVLLWPQVVSLPDALHGVVPAAAAHVPMAKAAPPAARMPGARVSIDAPSRTSVAAPSPALREASDPRRVQLALFGLVQFGSAEPYGFPAPPARALAASAPATLDHLPPLPERWSASAWLVARPGTGIGAAPGGSQLGGSQAGLRLAYMLVPRARLAGFGRVTAPLRGKGREAALGLEWQPLAAPVRVVAEQRFGLDGTRGGPGLGLVGGVDAAVPAGFRLESYAQAGAVRRARIEPYIDGAVRATRGVAQAGGVRLALGAGVWGAAQRDARRLDLGPSATLAIPAAGQRLRVSLDWRQRVAGSARPGSGLALTLGGDF